MPRKKLETKTCKTCGEVKHRDDFKGNGRECKDCYNAASRVGRAIVKTCKACGEAKTNAKFKGRLCWPCYLDSLRQEHRVCDKCGENKPVAEFEGRSTHCGSCKLAMKEEKQREKHSKKKPEKPTTKTCKKCGATKKNENFHGKLCGECFNGGRAEKRREKVGPHKKKTENEKKADRRIHYANKWDGDIGYRLQVTMSGAIYRGLKRNAGSKKGNSSWDFLPYTVEELRAHLEGLFEPWMTWDNWGNYRKTIWKNDEPNTWTWHIDHILPKSEFYYTSMEDLEFQKCWSLENLRPLSAKQNIVDGSTKVRHRKEVA